MKSFLVPAIAVLVLCFSVSAQADLVDNGNGLIYDTDLNITWYVVNTGNMTWSEAMQLVGNLSVDGVTGWRLPTATNFDGSYPSYGYNVVTNELGHLFYEELGNDAHGSQINTDPFENLQIGNYWTDTTTSKFAGNAFAFNFGNGYQGHANKNLSNNFYVITVHEGNIGGSHTPIPASVFLFAPALVGLAALRKRRNKDL